MESKEKLERIENFIDGSPITKEYRESLNADVKVIEKDLDELEELKKIMGTLIQDIMKRLKILEILKEHISFKIDERQCDKYLIKMVSEDTGNYTYIRLYEEEVKKLLGEWLDEKEIN